MKILPSVPFWGGFIASVVIALLSGPSAPRVAAEAKPGASQLKELCEGLHIAITSGDEAKAAKITQALLPDKARLQRALSDDVSPEILQKIVAFHDQIPKEPAKLAKLLQATPEQKVVMVHASTTPELAAYAKDSPAYKEFPQATSELAKQKILRSDATFYEVEFLEPGKDAGMKYHLFYWDGNAWSMLGPIWRALK